MRIFIDIMRKSIKSKSGGTAMEQGCLSVFLLTGCLEFAKGAIAFPQFSRRSVQIAAEEHPHPALRVDPAASGDLFERKIAAFHKPAGMFHTHALQKIGKTVAGLLCENMQEA